MRRLLLLTFLVLLLGHTYAQRLNFSPSIPVEKLRIIVDQLRGGTVSESLTDLEYIPLGGGKKDVISYLGETVLLEDRIIIQDMEKGHVLIYDIKGNLLKRISDLEGYKTTNKRHFLSIEKNKEGFNLYGQKLKAVMDKDGNVLEKNLDFTFPKNASYFTLGDTKFDQQPLFVAKDTIADYALKMNDSILITYNRRDSIRQNWFQGASMLKITDDKGFAVFPHTYQIFELNPTGISKVKQFVFPFKNTIDTVDYHYFKDFQKLFPYLQKNRDKIYGVGRPQVYQQYLILYIGSMQISNWIAFNMETNEVINLNKVLPDKSNDFLEFLDYNFLKSDGTYIYSVIYPSNIQRAKDKSIAEGHTLRKEYADFEKSLNPILVRFKLK